MSYPRFLQPLVIEDEAPAKGYYEELFTSLSDEKLPVLPPRFAFCLEDAQKLLAADHIYHLVILDLRLPEHPNEPPPTDVNGGLAILSLCETRENYPIPGMLVISGHLEKADQGMLDTRVRKGFAYGRVLVKGSNLGPDIRGAVVNMLAYCDVGIHVRDGGAGQFPTLAPREEDLLRRAVLDEGQCVGLDLGWWTNEYAPPRDERDIYAGWTKTLQGKTLISKGRGGSRPRFYKLTPAAGAGAVGADARLMAAKLPHIKVVGEWTAGSRNLLVTEKVGESNAAPIALSDFLARPAAQVISHLPALVVDVASQVRCLGDMSPDLVTPTDVLWPSHDATRLQAQWDRWSRDLNPDGLGDPVALFQELVASKKSIRIEMQSALHGDLNITNVALDLEPNVRGFIFDASGTAPGPDIRDLAALEVTALLHQAASESLVSACAIFYPVPGVVPFEPGAMLSDRVANTSALIGAIRDLEAVKSQPLIYALAVFDQALIQLGGLAFAVSRNKIHQPTEAARLAGLITCWTRHIVSSLLQ